jgi:hypothetical protein
LVWQVWIPTNQALSFYHSSLSQIPTNGRVRELGTASGDWSYMCRVVLLGHVRPRCYLDLWVIRWQFGIPTEFSKQKRSIHVFDGTKPLSFPFPFHFHERCPISIPFPAATISISLFLIFLGNKARSIGNFRNYFHPYSQRSYAGAPAGAVLGRGSDGFFSYSNSIFAQIFCHIIF